MPTRSCYKRSVLLASVSIVELLIAAPGLPAAAQVQASTPAPASSPVAVPVVGLEEVVVTARKRNEKLLDVPIAITAFTAKNLQERGIYSISDLANQTPGLSVDSTVSNSGRNDRSFPEYVIRGMVPSLQTNPTTTVFLDGAPLVSGQIDNLENLARVEVLKGPQSAYFGRETFAGAISLVTRDPANAPTVSLDLLAASPNYYDEHIGFEGAIIPDKLWVSAGYRFYSRQGSYDNQAVANKSSNHLGDQSTQSGNVEIVVKPTEDLKVKFLGLYWHDDDGPSAQALILPSQRNHVDPDLPGVEPLWFDGVVPDRLSSQPSANTLVTPAIQRLLATLGSPAGNQVFKPLNDGYGLVRNAYHGSMNADYNVESLGLTLTSLTAIDNQRFSELQDLANDDGSIYPNAAYALGLPLANSYADYPFFVEDSYRSLSQEVRITSDQDQRFRYLFGGNYEWTRVEQSLGGGNGFDFFSPNSPNDSTTLSFFYGLNYDILPNLTVSAEGRYQADKIGTSPAGGSARISQTYGDFLPRFSLQYKVTPRIMGYVTYSEGVNPGNFNGNIPTLPLAVQHTLSSDYGATVEVKPEKLTNYEAGVKGRFFDNTLTLSADVYYDIWYRQINLAKLNYFVGPDLEDVQVDLNDGKTDLKGLEADLVWQPIEGLTINAAGAINDTKIIHGGCYTCLEQTGTTDVDGNQLPDVSRYQATIGAAYTNKLSFLADTALGRLAEWSYFGRADYTYKSGAYEDKDDLVRTPAENLVNLRAGLTHDSLTIEGFVDNVTNWGGPTSLTNIVDLGNPAETYRYTADALVAGLPYLRTFGLRLRYKFGLPEPAMQEPNPPAPAPVAAVPGPQPARTYLVFFDWDRADLTSRAQQIVATAAATSQSGRATKVQVDGYTDRSGTVAYNQRLSLRRAMTVKTELVRDGVPAGEIIITGHGESNPLVPTAQGVREPQNRRVEIELL